MRGPELTFLERTHGGGRDNDRHLSTVLVNYRPVLTADVELAAALARAVVEGA